MTVFFTLGKKLHISVYQPHIEKVESKHVRVVFYNLLSLILANSNYRELHSDSFGGHYYKLMLNTLLPISFNNKHK